MTITTGQAGLFTGPAWDKRVQAERILAEVDAMPAPSSPEGATAVKYARDYLAGELDVHARVLNGSLDPYDLHEPDMAWWDDPEERAAEVAADRALDAAFALRKRAAEHSDTITRAYTALKRASHKRVYAGSVKVLAAIAVLDAALKAYRRALDGPDRDDWAEVMDGLITQAGTVTDRLVAAVGDVRGGDEARYVAGENEDSDEETGEAA